MVCFACVDDFHQAFSYWVAQIKKTYFYLATWRWNKNVQLDWRWLSFSEKNSTLCYLIWKSGNFFIFCKMNSLCGVLSHVMLFTQKKTKKMERWEKLHKKVQIRWNAIWNHIFQCNKNIHKWMPFYVDNFYTAYVFFFFSAAIHRKKHKIALNALITVFVLPFYARTCGRIFCLFVCCKITLNIP